MIVVVGCWDISIYVNKWDRIEYFKNKFIIFIKGVKLGKKLKVLNWVKRIVFIRIVVGKVDIYL